MVPGRLQLHDTLGSSPLTAPPAHLRRRVAGLPTVAWRLALGWGVVAILACGSTPARAQETPGSPPPEPAALMDLPLEDLLKIKVDAVFAASRVAQEVTHAPASVTIVTREEIRAHGYRTLADVLRSVRGFYVTNDRNYSYVGVRGYARPGDYNCRVLVLVNGHRLNDTIFEGALIGTESPLHLALFERIEIIRGPSSSVYGTSAFFGVINLITRPGATLNGVELEGQTGSQATRSARVTAGGRSVGGIEGLVSATAFATDGNRRLYYPEFDTPAQGDGVALDADADAARSLYGSIARGALQLQAGFGSRRKTVPTGAFDTVFNDPRTRTRDARGFVDLEVTRRLRPRTHVVVRASYDQYAYDGAYAYDSGLFTDNARGAWVTTEVTGVRRFDRHSLTAGVEYRDNLRQDQAAADETGTVLDDRRSSRTVGVYAEDELRISARVLLNAGIRYDEYFSTFGGTLNPRVALIVSPGRTTTLKMLYGQAFRAPNPYELYYDRSALSAALGPERISTREAVAEQRVGRFLQLTASLFHNHVSDLITQRSGSPDSLDGLYYQNMEGVSATGAEYEVQGEWPGHVRLRMSHAFQSVRDRFSSQRISNSPGQVASIVVDAPIRQTGLLAAFDACYVGERYAVHGDPVGDAFVANLTVSREPASRGLGFAASIHNLFDTRYADPGSVEHRQRVIVQDGRTLVLRASWRF
jgi:outer membrane receptor for ferrienterochelin and colicins